MKKVVLNVELSDEDFRTVSELAAQSDCTLSGMVHDFLADLAGGKSERGSDEHDYAYGWWERGNIMPESFLSFLCNSYGIRGVESFIESFKALRQADYDADDDLKEYGRACLTGTPEEIEEARKKVEESQNTQQQAEDELMESFREYQKSGGREDQAEAFRNVRRFYQEFKIQEEQLQEDDE